MTNEPLRDTDYYLVFAVLFAAALILGAIASGWAAPWSPIGETQQQATSSQEAGVKA